MSEFLVEVRPGREILYRSTWALREAMRSGVISGDSRIFHRATSQWVSITQHPEYRRFLTDAEPAWLQPAPSERVEGEAAAEPARPNRLETVSQLLRQLARRVAGSWAEWKRRLAAPPPPPSPPTPRAPAARTKSPGQTPPTPPPGEVPRPPEPSPKRDTWTYFP